MSITITLKNVALQWATADKTAASAVEAREACRKFAKSLRSREKAKAALAPRFAAQYGAALNDEGNFVKESKGYESAKKALNRLLAKAFGGGSNNASSPLELLVAAVSRSGLSKAKCLAAVEAAFRK